MTKKLKHDQNLKEENQLARVASRGELYQESLWHNFGRHLGEESLARMFSAIFNLCIAHYTDFIDDATKTLEPSFQFMPDFRRLSYNRVSNNDVLQYGINLTIFYLVFITLFVAFKRFGLLDLFHQPFEPNDAFDQNLSEKKCLERIDKLNDQKSYYIFETFIPHSIYLSCIALSLSYSTSSSIKTAAVGITSSQIFKIMDQAQKKTRHHFKERYIFPSQAQLCDIINSIIGDTDISFKASENRRTSLICSDTAPTILMLGVPSKYKNYISLDINIEKMNNKFFLYEYKVRYYIILVIKQIVEQLLDYKVMALDDSSLIINANKKIDCNPFEIKKKKEQASQKINNLILMIKFSDRYLRVLNHITENNTLKKWNKIFDIRNQHLFSFSLNIEHINCDVEEIMSNIGVIFPHLKSCIYGSKLIVEGELNKIKRSQTSQVFNLKNESKSKISIVKFVGSDNLSVPIQNKPQLDILEKKNYFTDTTKSLKLNNKLPKIHGRNHFLFSPQKKPKVVSIDWNMFKSYSQDVSPYYPLSHGCSNKTIFYSAFTLEETDFTMHETKQMFLNILKNGIVRTGNTPGSCIKLLTHAERMKLKSKILNRVKDPDLILFKLHTIGDSRVYGILKDEGVARYDDGSKIKVKMIEWCIIDQTSHKDTSHNIYFSINNPYLENRGSHPVAV